MDVKTDKAMKIRNRMRVPNGYLTFNFNSDREIIGFDIDQDNLLDVYFDELNIKRLTWLFSDTKIYNFLWNTSITLKKKDKHYTKKC